MELLPVPHCPVCTGAGTPVIREAADPTCGVQGAWSYRRCGRCGTLWMDPRPVDSAIPALYPESYYTHGEAAPVPAGSRSLPSGLWQAAQRAAVQRLGYRSEEAGDGAAVGAALLAFPPVAREAPRAVRFLPRIPGGKLLDVGCGNGAFLERMQRLGWEVEGLEPDSAAAGQAQRRGFRVRCARIEEAQLPPKHYDAITLSHVLEHLPLPAAALSRLAAALKPGGFLVSISPNPAGILARRYGRAWRELDPPRHLVLPSPAGCRILCRRLGVKARVFTLWSESHWVRGQSRQIRASGRVADTVCGLGDRLYGYSIAPLTNWLWKDSGEEVVIVGRVA